MTTGLKDRRGFSLTELAVVLLVAGIIIGAVWIAVGNVWNSYRVSRANQQIATSVMNIRDYYSSCQQLPPGVCNVVAAPAGPGQDLTATLDGLNLLPPEMRRKTSVLPGAGPIDHTLNNNYVSASGGAANGSFHVTSSTCPVGAFGYRCMMISLMGLTQGPCIKLLTSAPITNNELGIVKIGAQNMVSNTIVTTASVSPATAEGWCNVAGDTNEVDILFKLHP